MAENGLLYLTDRCANKIRSFDPDTKIVTEICDLRTVDDPVVLPEDIIAVGPSNDFKLYFT